MCGSSVRLNDRSDRLVFLGILICPTFLLKPIFAWLCGCISVLRVVREAQCQCGVCLVLVCVSVGGVQGGVGKGSVLVYARCSCACLYVCVWETLGDMAAAQAAYIVVCG